jgi:hypothetical protein
MSVGSAPMSAVNGYAIVIATTFLTGYQPSVRVLYVLRNTQKMSLGYSMLHPQSVFAIAQELKHKGAGGLGGTYLYISPLERAIPQGGVARGCRVMTFGVAEGELGPLGIVTSVAPPLSVLYLRCFDVSCP